TSLVSSMRSSARDCSTREATLRQSNSGSGTRALCAGRAVAATRFSLFRPLGRDKLTGRTVNDQARHAMARTQAPDYEERRNAMLEKAAELYAERGFLGASLADLAASCRTSKSLIYHYYPSKEDILFDVMH